MGNEGLKNCPFCDGEVTWCHCSIPSCAIIVCGKCKYMFEINRNSKIKTLKIWNTRKASK